MKHLKIQPLTLTALICISIFLGIWLSRTLDEFHLSAWLFLSAMIVTVFFLGDAWVSSLQLQKTVFDGLPFKLLVGSISGFASLYIMALALPWGLTWIAALVLLISVLFWFLMRRSRGFTLAPDSTLSELAFIFVALIATSFWCRDLLRPIDSSQSVTIIRAWSDVYYHLSQIASFSRSEGIQSLSDVQMAGAPVRPYHFASYVFPAMMVRTTGISAWATYASFLVPFGIFATSLAAYSLTAPIFGSRPAWVAGLGLLLLPDALQQGFSNPFMGYHWLQQVAPAGAYGVACAALSWIFMMEACRTRRWRLIVISYGFLGVTLIFKAQIFVAVAYLLFIFPSLFYPGPRAQTRVIYWLIMTIIFVLIVEISQSFPGVPTLRLNWTSVNEFAQMILNNQLTGPLQGIFKTLLHLADGQVMYVSVTLAFMLLLVTFGLWPICLASLMRKLVVRLPIMDWTFPLLVLSVFLVMATGLAMDDHQIGMREELLHRPFVWAYFVLVAWTLAGLSFLYLRLQNAAYLRKWQVFFVVILLMYVPAHFGQKIQTIPSLQMNYQVVPSCLVRAANFLRLNSLRSDLVQDSRNDPKYLMAGLSERAAYAVNAGGYRTPQGLTHRLDQLELVRRTSNASKAHVMLHEMGVQWYVVNADPDVKWIDASSIHIKFNCDQLRIISVPLQVSE